MKIKLNLNKKDEVGELLKSANFTEQAESFLKQHYGGRNDLINIEIKGDISIEFIECLRDIAKSLSLKGLQTQCSQIHTLISDTEKSKIKSLRSLEIGMISFLNKNAIKGWLYKKGLSEFLFPYLVTDVKFHEARPDMERPARVVLKLLANRPSKDSVGSLSINFESKDVLKKKIPQILYENGLVKETPEMYKSYEEAIEAYQKIQPAFGNQFNGRGRAKVIDSLGFSESENLSHKGISSKLVNDEEDCEVRDFENYISTEIWEFDEEEFQQIPYHPFIRMFDLEKHHKLWVYSLDLSPYNYNKSLKDKLVLPEEHRDLIDILVDDMDVVMDDFIEGKSGGSTILCMGEAGLGKTLTAEIYSEIIERPLYRVHSGQLGSNPNDVEKKLSTILNRAERWKAVLLIDEADVYIRTRDNSMSHNAIVAAFLRKLEYFSGLLFLTTNRSNDVDDAIKSRCIAVIKYLHPGKKDAMLIWKKISTQFQIDLSDELIDTLTDKYPRAAGRDIKELLKLASKYNRIKNATIDEELFRQCAIFRGIDMGDKK